MKKVMLLAPDGICDIVQAALKQKYIILPCSDPAAARELFQLKPDALILNLFLVGTDGLAFLRENTGSLPPVIIALTAFISDAILQELVTLGIQSVILIPCSPSYLENQLAELL